MRKKLGKVIAMAGKGDGKTTLSAWSFVTCGIKE